MLHTVSPGLAAFRYDNWGTNPSATPGTSVIPGATNAEGSWTQVASSANIAQDVVGFSLQVTNGATSGQQKSHLLDVGIDPAGGTSYTAAISNIVCGQSGSVIALSGHNFYFPLSIKSGSSVAVRVQGNNGTAGTVRVAVRFHGQVSGALALPCGWFSETIGTITNSSGNSFTPGNAADGSWASLGTTTNPMWWWQLGYQISNSSTSLHATYIDLAWGDGSNKHLIKRLLHGGNTTEQIGDFLGANLNPFESYCPTPAGATLYVRGRCSAAPDTGYDAVAIGIG